MQVDSATDRTHPGPDQQAALPRPRLPKAPQWVISLLSNRKACVGLVLLAFFFVVAIVGPLVWTGDPSAPDYSIAPMSGPSHAHWFGTDQQGHDIFLQMIDGTRPVLILGFSIAILASLISIVGMVGGYAGGWVDEVVTMITNIFLVIPGLPMVIVISAWVQVKSDFPIILIITLTSWAGGRACCAA